VSRISPSAYGTRLTWLIRSRALRSNSGKCKHIFSRSSITDLIRSQPGQSQVECPVAGCSKKIALSDLVDDPQMERRVKQKIRREEERQNQQSGYQEIDDDEDDDAEAGDDDGEGDVPVVKPERA
jgi:hypothetical protein